MLKNKSFRGSEIMGRSKTVACMCEKCGMHIQRVYKSYDEGYGFHGNGCGGKMVPRASILESRRLDKAKREYEEIILAASAISNL